MTESWDPLEGRRELERVLTGRIELRPGDRVRLRPRRRGTDVMDLALAGRAATVTALEQDYEGRIHVAVTVDDDPGRDFGEQGKPAHRFYFGLDEVEPVEADDADAGRQGPSRSGGNAL
jgi:hypothetical protein